MKHQRLAVNIYRRRALAAACAAGVSLLPTSGNCGEQIEARRFQARYGITKASTIGALDGHLRADWGTLKTPERLVPQLAVNMHGADAATSEVLSARLLPLLLTGSPGPDEQAENDLEKGLGLPARLRRQFPNKAQSDSGRDTLSRLMRYYDDNPGTRHALETAAQPLFAAYNRLVDKGDAAEAMRILFGENTTPGQRVVLYLYGESASWTSFKDEFELRRRSRLKLEPKFFAEDLAAAYRRVNAPWSLSQDGRILKIKKSDILALRGRIPEDAVLDLLQRFNSLPNLTRVGEDVVAWFRR